MTKSTWKKAALFASLAIGLLVFAVVSQTENNEVEPVHEISTPVPAKTSTVVSDKTVTVQLGEATGMGDIGKLRHLSSAIKKYPKHDEITIKWIVPQPRADYPGNDVLIYKRRKGELRYESWWSNFFQRNQLSHVTDAAIHAAAKEASRFSRRAGTPERWIKALLQHGCKVKRTFD